LVGKSFYEKENSDKKTNTIIDTLDGSMMLSTPKNGHSQIACNKKLKKKVL
jgi:hypothetical protein